MRIFFLLLAFTAIRISLFAQEVVVRNDASKYAINEISKHVDLLAEMAKTSPLKLDDKRLAFLKTIELYSDPYSDQPFKDYMRMNKEDAEALERTIPIFKMFRGAFDKVLREVKVTKVKKGSVAIWMLYNMGFVVKTPSVCFGIDVHHRIAEDLAPYLDFLCITHNHGDHANEKLITAMQKLGKPVVSNFNTVSEHYMSKAPTVYKIGDITIRTDLSDHLLDPKLPDFVTIYRIDCGKDTDNFTLMHCGDSGFNPDHFKKVEGSVDLLVLRWGAARENNIIGNGVGQVQPKYAILSHLIEMAHQPYPKGQASITQTLKHLPQVNCENTIIPFWGEKLVWKNENFIDVR